MSQDPEVEKELEQIEKDAVAFARHQARAQAGAMLATMPDFWKEKFRQVAKTHFSCRKGRRATAKLLREYAAWTRSNERVHLAQANEKDLRAKRLAGRAALGLPLLKGSTQDHVDAAIAYAGIDRQDVHA